MVLLTFAVFFCSANIHFLWAKPQFPEFGAQTPIPRPPGFQFPPIPPGPPRPAPPLSAPPLRPGPLPHASRDEAHCALYVPGTGQDFNVFNNVEGFNGPDTCITYDAVNAAFSTALDKIGLPRPAKQDFTPRDIGNLAEVIIEAARILARQYSLPYDAIYNGLPLIDTSKTIITDYCPTYLKTPKCTVSRYRPISGLCNNLDHPHWGAKNTAFKRLIPPKYGDGLNEPRVGFDGASLPSVRAVSSTVHIDAGVHDHAITMFAVAWGQFIDHDMTLTAESRIEHLNREPECCDNVHESRHPACLPISVHQSDSFYSLFGRKCMNFVRSLPSLNYQCKLGPRSQLNQISSYIDANVVYGSSDELLRNLRAGTGGLMKMLPVFREFGLKDLLPLKLEEPEDGCIRPTPDVYCFLAGDNRVNEQLVLAVVHTLMVREHNRLATEMSHINPHWDDERIFQECRHIISALIQHITYNEFLPMILGKEVMGHHDLILEPQGYYGGYNKDVDASMTTNFVTAAFRFGHSLLPSTIERWNKRHKYIGSQRLSDMLRQPYDLYKGGWADHYMLGLMNQVAQAMDDFVTQEVTNHLFQKPEHRFGLDLAALNMQRGREHGLPSYNEFRELCGLPAIRDWNHLHDYMSNITVMRYSQTFKHPADMDLWSAGISERPLPGSMVGPTFACLIGRQFAKLRQGDRFWYENGGWPSSFSPAQLDEIRKVKLSRIICDNSDDLDDIQVYVMVLHDHNINPRVPCRSEVLPRMNMNAWREHFDGPVGFFK